MRKPLFSSISNYFDASFKKTGIVLAFIRSENRHSMVAANKIVIPKEEQGGEKEEQTWENPSNPEQASDLRDIEQLERQKKEAEQRKNNLSDTDNDN